MPLWKIIIEGQTAFDVQGVNLRESIVRLANKKGINCIVKNRKGTKIVEIICKCKDENEAKMFKNIMSGIPEENPVVKFDRIDIREPEVYSDPAIKEEDVKGFEIEREDDLTEMVWALQNAGKTLLIQQKLRDEMHIRALKAELEDFKEVLNKIEEGNPYKEPFTIIAIETCLSEPPGKNVNLTAKLHHLYRYAKAINLMIAEDKDKSEMPIDEIRKLLGEITYILEGS